MMSGSEIEPRMDITKAGWVGRRGQQPGPPMLHVERIRKVGLDKNLQVSASSREAWSAFSRVTVLV